MYTRLIILTSRKNYIWVSMEEIITWIENTWEAWAIERKIPFRIINVDDSGFKTFAKDVFTSELIVVTCFNASIANYLLILRERLLINSPWVFYLHGLASFGCWPLFHWKIGHVLNSKDVFIGSCERDKRQFELIFENIDCKIIPFGFPNELTKISVKSATKKKLAFIGRISSQKNLHSLILALSFLKYTLGDSEWEMHFFGKEDNYGSPLMGRRDDYYQTYLENMTAMLKLDEHIHFHGFLPREEIEFLMDKEQWIFISPSMHSDENFGMAAFRCLINGHKAILSDWGGHSDFIKEFRDSVILLPVYKSPIGPFIDIQHLAKVIRGLTLNTLKIDKAESFPEYYSKKRTMLEFDTIWNSNSTARSIEQVKTTALLKEILLRKDYFKQSDPNSTGTQIFYDYKDKLKDVFFDAYGQTEYEDMTMADNLQFYPWVIENDLYYEVNDPHRGQFSLAKKDYQKKDLISLGLAWTT